MLLHRNINTCFVMMTDGEAGYPDIEIKLFLQVRDYMITRGYRFCALCYFIRENDYDNAPNNFVRLCTDILAESPTGSPTVYYFQKSSGGASAQRAAAPASPVQEVSGANLDQEIHNSFANAAASIIRGG